jgi:hypothetical protein
MQDESETVIRGELPNLDQFLIFLMYSNMKHCRKETYGNKISMICTFVSYIYRDQKHLIKVGQEKLNY